MSSVIKEDLNFCVSIPQNQPLFVTVWLLIINIFKDERDVSTLQEMTLYQVKPRLVEYWLKFGIEVKLSITR